MSETGEDLQYRLVVGAAQPRSQMVHPYATDTHHQADDALRHATLQLR